MTHQTNWKPSRTVRKKEERRVKVDRRAKEDTAKKEVRKRDVGCRFPMCGCRKQHFRLEVSHDRHKGMGGNPAGDRSTTREMVQMCIHRHQFGAISRHNGTLRSVYLTEDGYDGPVAWEIDRNAKNYAATHSDWFEVARESTPGILEPLTPEQALVLTELASMDY